MLQLAATLSETEALKKKQRRTLKGFLDGNVYALHPTLYGKSLVKPCDTWRLATARWCAANINPYTNTKPWAAVGSNKLTGPSEHDRRKVHPINFCPHFPKAFYLNVPSGLPSCYLFVNEKKCSKTKNVFSRNSGKLTVCFQFFCSYWRTPLKLNQEPPTQDVVAHEQTTVSSSLFTN